MKRNIIALIYDFDKTLTDKDMQDYGFIPSLGMTPEDFGAIATTWRTKRKWTVSLQ